MDGQEGKQQPPSALAHKLFLLNHPDVDDMDKVRLRDEVLNAVKPDDMASLYESLAARSVLEMDAGLLELMRRRIEEVKKLDDRRKNPYKDPDDGRQRFLLELEFVQCLANPTYIHYLAQNRYFEDEAFIGYLKYLQYWQRPEYIKFIMYPHCLFFLELLQNANFRNAMAHPGSKELAHRQQYFFWKSYRNNRLKHILPRPLPEPVAPPVPPPPASALAPAPAHAPPASLPPMTAAGGSTLPPMQFVGTPGSNLPKADMRNTMGDRRKRKKEG